MLGSFRNNDGCAIARSNEAKALGIKMGAPWFQIRHLAESDGLVALSANFALYGDMSDRMMSVAAGMGPTQEVYSIDETFIGLDGVRGDLSARGRKVRERILQWTGIPTCVGIGPTKTLAKLANHVAKSAERKPGSYPAELAQVCDLSRLTPEQRTEVFKATAVEEVWGIGRRISKQLKDAQIETVQDFIELDTATVRAGWSVVLERTHRELRGTSCIEIEDAPQNKQEIACTRSFGRAVTELDDLSEAVSTFASRAAEKLRKQDSYAGQVLTFIRTSPFRPDPQYSRSVIVPLRRPTADTAHIASAALTGLRAIYRVGFKYAKAGVMLLDLQDATVHQHELDLEADECVKDKSRLMSAMDQLNRRYGRGTLLLGSSGLDANERIWSMKQERLTPQYTTKWSDLVIARA